MRKYKIYYTFLLLTAVVGCELMGELDEVDTGFSMVQESVIKDLNTAETVVSGVYAMLKTGGYGAIPRRVSEAGLSSKFGPPSTALYFNNSIPVDESLTKTIYSALYVHIQQANLAIDLIGKATDEQLSSEQRSDFIAELKFTRALSNFYLLRIFGQHWDLSSSYGISIRTAPANSPEALPRNTVQETYDQILSDLDDAITNGSDGGPSYRASREAAQACKARVLLYMGNYSEAASLAGDLINTTSKDFHATYDGIFKNAFSSPEIFFAPMNTVAEDPGSLVFRIIGVSGSVYESLAAGDPRFGTAKSSASSDSYRGSHIHMRLPELYLIHAEAKARVGSGVDAEALASLNAVRTRTAVGLVPAAPASKAELLEAIRMEKLFELYSEGGEDLFDVVRYHAAGDLIASDVKTTLLSTDQFIFPIPIQEIRESNGVVVQNPGYPEEI